MEKKLGYKYHQTDWGVNLFLSHTCTYKPHPLATRGAMVCEKLLQKPQMTGLAADPFSKIFSILQNESKFFHIYCLINSRCLCVSHK